jgi:hypothetical protein
MTTFANKLSTNLNLISHEEEITFHWLDAGSFAERIGSGARVCLWL